jgi:tetratricopeptide (TPR) repeat protein
MFVSNVIRFGWNCCSCRLRSGTEVNKRHAPVWQAWGVLETRYGAADEARGIFQQGIWSCAQVVGGQSGGYNCARLWQAWGVLEAREGDHAAARRCFSRALDADNRNIAAIVAWTQMEQDLGNVVDARSIFERALKQLPAASNDKMAIWRSYEQMEKNAGNTSEALQVYQRSMREAMIVHDDVDDDVVSGEVDDGKQAEVATSATKEQRIDDVLQQSEEVEVERWNAESMRGEVWMNNGSIEGKLPKAAMKRAKQNKRGMALNSFSNTR